MATFTPSFGADSAGSMTATNLQSLADGGFWESGTIAAAELEKEIFVTLASTTTAGDANGYAKVYIAGSVDGGTDYAGTSPDGTESTETFDANTDQAMDLVATIPMDASETTARTWKKLINIGRPPKDYVVVVENQSGAALASSGCLVEEMEVNVTDA